MAEANMSDMSETFEHFTVDDDSVEEGDFEVGLGTGEELGSHPYMFEPELAEDDDVHHDPEPQEPADVRTGNINW